MSKGIINGVALRDRHGSPAGILVSGISHTIVIDDMKKSRFFLKKNLQDIALEIFSEESSGEFYELEEKEGSCHHHKLSKLIISTVNLNRFF